jgi:hypothetical protein
MHGCCCGRGHLRRDEVQSPELVIGSPSTPVGKSIVETPDLICAHGFPRHDDRVPARCPLRGQRPNGGSEHHDHSGGRLISDRRAPDEVQGLEGGSLSHLEADRCARGRQEPHPTSPDQPIVMDDSAQPTRPFQPRRIDGLRWFRSPVLRLGRPLAGQMLPGCLVESGSRRPDTHVPGCTPLTRSRWASSRQPTYG